MSLSYCYIFMTLTSILAQLYVGFDQIKVVSKQKGIEIFLYQPNNTNLTCLLDGAAVNKDDSFFATSSYFSCVRLLFCISPRWDEATRFLEKWSVQHSLIH